jgi:hypothetical protein
MSENQLLDNEIRRRAAQGGYAVEQLKDEVMMSGAMKGDFEIRVVLQRRNPNGQLFKAVLE